MTVEHWNIISRYKQNIEISDLLSQEAKSNVVGTICYSKSLLRDFNTQKSPTVMCHANDSGFTNHCFFLSHSFKLLNPSEINLSFFVIDIVCLRVNLLALSDTKNVVCVINTSIKR